MSFEIRQVINVDKDKCVNCHLCVWVCPAKMCNDGSGDHVNVNYKLCIGCGRCLDACSLHLRGRPNHHYTFLQDTPRHKDDN